jgi:LysR family transcriptional activator of mexEF-oprN operon
MRAIDNANTSRHLPTARMKPIELGRIDLNLLTVLAALMRERHVSRAAQRLNLGQPAVSHALARLRELTGDPLLVRQGRVMEPTERALALMQGLGPALEQIEATFRAQADFEPARAAPVFRIGLTDDLQIAMLPRLLRALSAEVPRAKLVTLTVCYRNAMRYLDEGARQRGDGLPERPAGRRQGAQGRAPRASPCCAPTRATGKLSLDDYCRRRHVLVTYAGDLCGTVDETLDELGRAARRGVFGAAVRQPARRAGRHRAAGHCARARGAGAVCARRAALRGLPFESPDYQLKLAWRAVTDKDPAEAWLRKAMLRAFND